MDNMIEQETSKLKKGLIYFDKIAIGFEIVIAGLLLVVIAIKLFDTIMEVTGTDILIISMEFNALLSAAFALVIGVEFVRMLFKHTPEAVIDVLLFALARHVIIYYEGMTSLLVGVFSIAVLFATKKYLSPAAGNGIRKIADKVKNYKKDSE